ncbi:MAG: PAS domain S-box protein, partial [Perlabentimonas sp.]
MPSPQSDHKKLDALKRRAKELLGKRDFDPAEYSGKNEEELIESLQMYQVELEIQNEELIRSREVAEKNEERFKSLFANAPVGYCILENNGIVLDANKTFCDYLQLKPSKIIGKPFEKFISSESQDEYYFHNKNLFNEGVASTLISVGDQPNKLHFKISSRRIQLTADAGDVTLTTLNNITNEVNYQQKLAESEAKFRSLIDSIDDVVFTLDTQHRHTGVYGKWLEKYNQKP